MGRDEPGGGLGPAGVEGLQGQRTKENIRSWGWGKDVELDREHTHRHTHIHAQAAHAHLPPPLTMAL